MNTVAGPARRVRGRPVLVAGLITLALALLGASWTTSLPFNGTADEQSQYVKALGVSGGEPAGAPVAPLTGNPSDQRRFLHAASRQFDVPAQLNGQANSPCFVLKPDQPASCQVVTATGPATQTSTVGIYPPLAYVLPGLAARLAGDTTAAMIAARVANGITCAALWFVAGAAFLWSTRRRAWLLCGLLLSVTPAAVSLAWSVNPNGLEAAASTAFVALCLAATRPGAPRWMWWAMAPVGFVLAGSRPLAPIWVLFGLLVTVLLRGRTVVRAIRAGGRAAAVGLSGAALGGLATAAWDRAIGAHAAPGHRDWLEYLRLAWRQFEDLQGGVISQVDWGEIGMTSWLRNPWEFSVAAVVLVALLAGRMRDRLVMLLVLAAYFATCVAIVALTAPSGFPTGGRYVLAAAVSVPLVAAEIAQQRAARVGRVGLLLVGVVVGGTQLVVLAQSAHRYAVGVSGAWSFLWSGSSWRAYGGWALAAGLAVLGAVCLAGSVVLDGPARRSFVRPAGRRRELANR